LLSIDINPIRSIFSTKLLTLTHSTHFSLLSTQRRASLPISLSIFLSSLFFEFSPVANLAIATCWFHLVRRLALHAPLWFHLVRRLALHAPLFDFDFDRNPRVLDRQLYGLRLITASLRFVSKLGFFFTP
jgi:hypothetical protein